MISLASMLPFRGHVVAFRHDTGDLDTERKFDTIGIGIQRSDGELVPVFMYQGLFWTPNEFEEAFNVFYLGCFEQGAPVESFFDCQGDDEDESFNEHES